MTDGTAIESKDERVLVEFTHTFDKVTVAGGPQYNAGERASLPVQEARRLFTARAAVRVQDESGYDSGAGKALARPPHDKMVQSAKTK